MTNAEAPAGWAIRELARDVDKATYYRVALVDEAACASLVCKHTGLVEYMRTPKGSIAFDSLADAIRACADHEQRERAESAVL